ncbi:Gustatory receptor for sugar taste 64f, partial [Orchesella cincta]
AVLTYRQVGALCDKINSMFSFHLLALYIASLTFYSHSLVQTLTSLKNVNGSSHWFLYLFFNFYFWNVACKVHSKALAASRGWIKQIQTCSTLGMEEKLDLILFSNEVETNSVGLHCKLFMLTYRLMTSMCGSILTYAVIVHQSIR